MNESQIALVRRVLDTHRQFRHDIAVAVDGIAVRLHENVFNPFLAPSGPLMIHLAISGMFQGLRVLDCACGSGVGSALLVAKGGARQVVAVDINPDAVACASENARRFDVADRVDVRQGDLFAPIRSGEEPFDVVVADFPFADAEPCDMLERAFFDPGLTAVRQCLKQVDQFLAPEGRLILAWSDLTPFPRPPLQLSTQEVGESKHRVGGIELSLLELATRSGLQPRYQRQFEKLWDDAALRHAIEAIVGESSDKPSDFKTNTAA